MGTNGLVFIREKSLYIRDVALVECLSLFTASGKCMFSIETPAEAVSLHQLSAGEHLLVLNLKGGQYAVESINI
jgi:hypothetical protein